jgi:hypothetical protein
MFFFDNFCSNLVLEDDFENSDGCTHDEDNMLVHVGGECLVTKTNAYNYLIYFNCHVTKKQTNSHISNYIYHSYSLDLCLTVRETAVSCLRRCL